jgi:hypothetical protein
MSNMRYYLLLMVLYLGIVAGVFTLLYTPLRSAFMANWGFNSLILAALAIGVFLNFSRVLILEPEIKWIGIFRTGQSGLSVAVRPRLLRPLAKALEGLHRDRFSLSALSLRTVLEGIRGRLDESREISRYMIGLLVFLGLLGTFWGLLGTIAAVSNVVGGLDVGNRDFALVFTTLKAGLQKPLQGMGTAFSSSLFGLGGSLILGFLDIQANHAQNRFFNEMEEWLSGVTQLVDDSDSNEFERGVEGQIGILIHEIRKNNHTMAQLVKSGHIKDTPDEGPANTDPL